MKTTDYFKNNVLKRRTYLKTEWIKKVLSQPAYTEIQKNGRIRFWAFIREKNKYLRVITEPDGETIHNAFFDRGFRQESEESGT